ncbi:MAG: hypothetical protein JXD22_07615, partial [Sedimentisphaerales bacterium]|nr:hypothetical protein [Sedimentisphaerales bacterium]
ANVKDGISWSEVSNRPVGLDDGDDVGIAVESDPTVLSSVKDGVSWAELTSVPAGFADGTDNIGLNSVDGVSNQGGNIDLVAGANIDITPDPVTKTITFSTATGGSGIKQIIRGTITFPYDNIGSTQTVNFSPAINPSKALVVLPGFAVLSGTSGTNYVPAILTGLTSNSITITVQRIYIGGPHIISFQIVEYE